MQDLTLTSAKYGFELTIHRNEAGDPYFPNEYTIQGNLNFGLNDGRNFYQQNNRLAHLIKLHHTLDPIGPKLVEDAEQGQFYLHVKPGLNLAAVESLARVTLMVADDQVDAALKDPELKG